MNDKKLYLCLMPVRTMGTLHHKTVALDEQNAQDLLAAGAVAEMDQPLIEEPLVVAEPEIITGEEGSEGEGEGEGVDLDTLSAKELKAILDKGGRAYPSKATKAELIELILE